MKVIYMYVYIWRLLEQSADCVNQNRMDSKKLDLLKNLDCPVVALEHLRLFFLQSDIRTEHFFIIKFNRTEKKCRVLNCYSAIKWK